MEIKFGPAGTNLAFAADKKNKMTMFPSYLSKLGLSALEYQCGHGIRVKDETASEFGDECKKNSVFLSIHSPYYISLSSVEEAKRKNSIRYILQTAQLAKKMGARRVVIHSGSCAKISRAKALEFACATLKEALFELEENGLSEIVLCPELMGKTNQLGNLEEVIELCSLSESLVPCIDFGHLNARMFGGLSSARDFEEVFLKLENKLGAQRIKNIHIHFSKIQYSEPGGEVRHLNFDDEVFGPRFELLAEVLVKKSVFPVVICESAGMQVEDALKMQNIYNNIKNIY